MQPSFPTCTTCDSAGCFINKFVQPDSKTQVANHKTVHHYKKYQVIFHEGDPVSGIYFIYSGKVKVYNTGPDGRSQIVRFAGDGNILGHRGMGEKMRYPISAAAIEEAIICFIPSEDFINAMEHNPPLAINLVMFYASELRRAENKLRSLSQMTVKQKLADALLTVREIYGTRKHKGKKVLAVQLSRQEYADIVGASLEEVIRTLSQFKKEKVVELDGKFIGILKEKELGSLLVGFRDMLLPWKKSGIINFPGAQIYSAGLLSRIYFLSKMLK